MTRRTRLSALILAAVLATSCGSEDPQETPGAKAQAPLASSTPASESGVIPRPESALSEEAARLAAEADAAIAPLLGRRASSTPEQRAEELAEAARLDLEHDGRLTNTGVLAALHGALMSWNAPEPPPEVDVALDLLQHLDADNTPAGFDGTLVPMLHAGQVEAILAAGRIGDPSLLPMLEMVAGSDGDAASAGQAALARLGVPGHAENVVAGLSSPDRTIRFTTHERLAYLGTESARLALERCVASLGQADVEERSHAARALASISGQEAMPPGLSVAQPG